jgi:hypothetical protein
MRLHHTWLRLVLLRLLWHGARVRAAVGCGSSHGARAAQDTCSARAVACVAVRMCGG